jgi:hypothetical protein
VTSADWQVLTVVDHTTAVLVRGALQAEGLRAELDRDALGAVYGLSTGGHATRVVVPVDEADRARAVLAALDAPA